MTYDGVTIPLPHTAQCAVRAQIKNGPRSLLLMLIGWGLLVSTGAHAQQAKPSEYQVEADYKKTCRVWRLTMFKAKEYSIAQRLTWMNMLVSGVALLMACSAFIGYDVMTFRTVTLRDLSIRSQVIGSNSVSALIFNDPESAVKTLSALKADPHVLSAVIYTLDGQPFASYLPSEGDRIPPPPVISSDLDAVHWIKDNEIVVARHIVSEGKPVDRPACFPASSAA
jgi:hypothetical protein